MHLDDPNRVVMLLSNLTCPLLEIRREDSGGRKPAVGQAERGPDLHMRKSDELLAILRLLRVR